MGNWAEQYHHNSPREFLIGCYLYRPLRTTYIGTGFPGHIVYTPFVYMPNEDSNWIIIYSSPVSLIYQVDSQMTGNTMLHMTEPNK
jgi:hypothetical protein